VVEAASKAASWPNATGTGYHVRAAAESRRTGRR